MFVVIFEVEPKPDHFDAYLDLARHLKPRLERIEGFIDNERFKSRSVAGRVLSLSTWRDEKALIRWRTEAEHHRVQAKGRSDVFADYHLRVGEVVADTAPPDGVQLADTRLDETEVGPKAVTITEVAPRLVDEGAISDDLSAGLRVGTDAKGLVEQDLFESLYNPGKRLLLASWTDHEAAGRFEPRPTPAAGALRHRTVRIIRDYGMFERREAPQFYPAVEPAA